MKIYELFKAADVGADDLVTPPNPECNEAATGQHPINDQQLTDAGCDTHTPEFSVDSASDQTVHRGIGGDNHPPATSLPLPPFPSVSAVSSREWMTYGQQDQGLVEEEGREGQCAHKISWWSNQFVDAALEAEFVREQAGNDRVSICAGVVLHLTCILWQLLIVIAPNTHGYFATHGNASLARSMEQLLIILVSHSVVGVLSAGALIMLLWRREIFHYLSSKTAASVVTFPIRIAKATESLQPPADCTVRACVAGYVGLKLLHFLVSLVCLRLWKSQACVFFLFATGLMYNFGLSHCNYGVTYKVNVAMVLLTFVATGPLYFGAGIATSTANNYMGAQCAGSIVLVPQAPRLHPRAHTQ